MLLWHCQLKPPMTINLVWVIYDFIVNWEATQVVCQCVCMIILPYRNIDNLPLQKYYCFKLAAQTFCHCLLESDCCSSSSGIFVTKECSWYDLIFGRIFWSSVFPCRILKDYRTTSKLVLSWVTYVLKCCIIEYGKSCK